MERRLAWRLGWIVGSVLPLFAIHLYYLWELKPHYHFFPLLLLGIGWLAWERRPARIAVDFSGGALAVLLLGLAVLAVAVLLFSPWIGAIGACLTVGGLILGLADSSARRDLLLVWALLWLLIPPPLNWDQDLIAAIQSFASRASSLALDVFGIGHLMEGNVFVLPGHRLLVEEACSGINSLIAFIAITGLFVILARRPLIWSMLLLASSVCWAGLANAARVTTVAVGQAVYGCDLSADAPHTALGFAAVVFCLSMIVCTDRLLAFFLGPIVLPVLDHELNPLSRAWNWLTGWRDDLEKEPKDPAATASAPAEAAARMERLVPRWIVFGFAALGLLQLGGIAADALREHAQAVNPDRLHAPGLFVSTDLPTTLGDWTLAAFAEEEQQGDMGDFRQIWTYRSKYGEAAVAIAYPFRGWHDVRYCYSGRGWTILASDEHSLDSGSNEPGPYTAVRMCGLQGEKGLLLFNYFDLNGTIIGAPSDPTWDDIGKRLAKNPLLGFLAKGSLIGKADTFQSQAIFASKDAISDPQSQAVHRLFLAARQAISAAYDRKGQARDE